MLGAVDGFVADSLYVVNTFMHPKHRMTACDLKTMKPLADIINVGRGPNEYDQISIYTRVFRDAGDVSVWIFSSAMGQAARVNLTRSCREQRTVVDTTIVMGDHKRSGGELDGSVVTFDVINDSLALYRTVGRDMTLENGIYNYATRKIFRSFDMYDEIKGDPSLASGAIHIREDLGRVAFIPAGLDQFDYCDMDGENSFSVSTRKRPIKIEDVARFEMHERHHYVYGTYATGDRIIYCYMNRDTNAMELHIYDWDGNLLHVLQPDVAMSNISVTDDGVLYGFVSDTEICKADISEYLN